MIPEQKLQRKLKVIDQLWVIVENAAGMVFCTCIVNIDFQLTIFWWEILIEI